MRFRFGAYELDEEAGELRRGGAAVPIQPKPFELLRILLRERERVVSADELFEALWPGIAVTPGSLTRAVSVARRAIGDTRGGEVLKSFSRRGYRFTAPVDVVRPPGASPADEPASAPAGVGPPLVGRSPELERLRASFAEAAAGRGGVALVSGPAGIGKTRLVERFAAELAASAQVLVGRGREGGGVPAYWIFAGALRQLVGTEAGDEALGPLAAAAGQGAARPAARAAARVSERPALDPEQGRFRTFEAVARTLEQASRRAPLVLLLEDLQWAGADALRLLEHLAFELSGSPVLLLATVRDDPEAAGREVLERSLARLRQHARCIDLPLRGLSRGEVAALLERAIGGPPPPDLTSELFARTEGVPLYLREAIRLLEERGDLRRPERVRRWAVSLPEHVLDLIRRPLERLSPRAAELLAAAAAVGREFPLALAASVAGTARDEALDLLDEAELAGVVEPAPDAPACWRFGHALFQEAVYARLPAGRRARLHALVAEALERQHGGDLEPVIAELAHHHHQALAVIDPERAYASAVRASERARRLHAYDGAALHWEQAAAAVTQMEAPDPDLRIETLLALGEAHRLAGERGRRREAFTRALALARDLGRPSDAARAAIGLCDVSEWSARDPEARVGLAAAAERGEEVSPALRARLLVRSAYLDVIDSPAEAEPRVREAVALAREAGEPEALGEALYVLHFALAGPDHVEERRALVEELVARAELHRRRDPEVILLLDAAADALLVGDAAEAAALREQAGALAGESPHPGPVWHLRSYDAGLALLEGRFADAERLTEAALPVGARIEHPYARPVYGGHRGLLAFERGRFEEVFQWFDPTRPMRRGAVQWAEAFLARSLAAAGRREEARARLGSLAARRFEDVPRNMRWTGTMVQIAHLAADLHDDACAEALLERLEPVAHQHAVMALPICYGGPVPRALARLLAQLGRLGEADERFEEALDAADALGARPMVARILAEHAALLARRGSRRAAEERQRAALRLADELGLPGAQGGARAPA
jgi:DNA-binding winged helix-turn-helix (wHTH) protein/tetratricopeptide (TPR) repeat protein